MRLGVAPAGLLFVALGLAIAFAPRTARAASLLALIATLGAFAFVDLPLAWLDAAFLGFWIAVLATAASVHLVRRFGSFAVIALSINAGLWASAVTSLSGSSAELLKALPGVLILLPASWAVRRHNSVPVKVVSSWVVAIAVLAITLQLLPITPGYIPDHLE